MNARSIGIENVSAGQDFAPAQIAALRDVVTDIMRRYKIPASRVIRHHDVTGKACPAPYVNASKWKTLHSQITTPKPVAKPAPAPTVEIIPGRKIRIHATEELMNAGYKYTDAKKEERHMVINPLSGFMTQWSGGSGKYAESVAKSFGITGYTDISESHARAIQASLKAVRAGE